MVWSRRIWRRVLRHTVPTHAVNGKADAQPRPEPDRPERALPVEGLRVEEPAAEATDASIRQLQERCSLQRCNFFQMERVAGGMNRPPGAAQDGVLEMGAHGAKRARGTLLFRALGALESVVETMPPHGPCTFAQEAVKDEEPLGFRGAG